MRLQLKLQNFSHSAELNVGLFVKLLNTESSSEWAVEESQKTKENKRRKKTITKTKETLQVVKNSKNTNKIWPSKKKMMVKPFF